MDVIGAATAVAARCVGREAHLGTIAVGKHANFLAVAGDPVQDLPALWNVRAVMIGELVFYLYDRALGMSTLAGSAPSGERHAPGAGNLVGRMGSPVGGHAIAALGWLCDRLADLTEHLQPARRPAATDAGAGGPVLTP